MNMRILSLLILSKMLVFMSCTRHQLQTRSGESLMSPNVAYTQVNLHPDEKRKRLYAANFQQDGLIPVCTQVEIMVISNKKMIFLNDSNGEQYTYLNHKQANGDFLGHIELFFNKDCPQSEIDQLSELDRRGIQLGKALPGMTRKGVVLAMGYPPQRENPEYASLQWTYWKSRFNRLKVYFNEYGIVTHIQD